MRCAASTYDNSQFMLIIILEDIIKSMCFKAGKKDLKAFKNCHRTWLFLWSWFINVPFALKCYIITLCSVHSLRTYIAQCYYIRSVGYRYCITPLYNQSWHPVLDKIAP